MSDSRRTGLTEEEVEILANKILDKMAENKVCLLSIEEQQEVKNILTTKKRAIKATLWVAGLLILWILKDIYFYIKDHIVWSR